ncbi:UDP-glycosyltransferase 86A1-like [Sesamum indicum]|uniref:UDP-glycosyltransferase 86A1-like n=1 Tax=Sesamum indicum TaxID=4182 RepID=A0A6I9UA85_SESIN|nr:UDP-glycosyltransferase 86A1-like [Sesamum indicum]
MGESHGKPHAIMISVPYQGHINPFVNLALKIASKGFSITFVHLEFVHHKLSKAHDHTTTTDQVDFFSVARESCLDIRYTTICDGYPLEFDRDLHFLEYFNSLYHDFPARVDEFVGNIIQSDPYSLHFLVADTIYHWPATIAHKYNLVNVSFWTEPALVFSLGYHWDLLREKGHVPCKDNKEVEINYLPGVESISTRDVMSYLSGEEIILSDVLFLAFQEVKKADFILHNTVQELECETLSALNKYLPNYAIGPINFSKILDTNTISKSLWAESDCTEWLDSKSPGSVLYVSFGSLVQTSKQVIQEIAYGLLLSEVNFIWVVREGVVSPVNTNVLPTGYQDKVRDKGLVISWCNQIKVLSNPAVGGFLTHNGWNSTVERMRCGVPMICYPIAYDQLTNRKLVVDTWKIGISLCDGTSTVERNEVAEKIKSFMNGTAVEGLKKEAEKVKETLRDALQIDGSSERNFDQFIKDLKEKIHATAARE